MGFWDFLVVAVIVNAIAGVAKARSKNASGSLSSGEVDELHRRLDEQADALGDANALISDQSGQIEDLHERVEFAERLLSQVRNKPGLGAGQGE